MDCSNIVVTNHVSQLLPLEANVKNVMCKLLQIRKNL